MGLLNLKILTHILFKLIIHPTHRYSETGTIDYPHRGTRFYLYAVFYKNLLSSAEDANRDIGYYQICFSSLGGLEALHS